MDSSIATQVIVGSLGPYGAYLSDGSGVQVIISIKQRGLFEFHRACIDALITRGIHDFVFETVSTLMRLKLLLSIYCATL